MKRLGKNYERRRERQRKNATLVLIKTFIVAVLPCSAVTKTSLRGSSMSAATAPIIVDFGIYQKLNSVWHKRALNLFMFIVLAHWAEHLSQAYQIYVLGWPRPQAGGFLGLFYPWLVSRSEERRVGKECRSRWSADC